MKSENRSGVGDVLTEKRKPNWPTVVRKVGTNKHHWRPCVNEAKIRTIVDEIGERLAAIRTELTPVDPLACFIAQQCHDAPSETITFCSFHAAYRKWLKNQGIIDARGKLAIIDALERGFPQHPYGITHSNQRHVGNLSWSRPKHPDWPRLKRKKSQHGWRLERVR